MDGLISNARTLLGLAAWYLIGYLLIRYGRKIGRATILGGEQLKEWNGMFYRLIGLLMWLAPLIGAAYGVYDYFTR